LVAQIGEKMFKEIYNMKEIKYNEESVFVHLYRFSIIYLIGIIVSMYFGGGIFGAFAGFIAVLFCTPMWFFIRNS